MQTLPDWTEPLTRRLKLNVELNSSTPNSTRNTRLARIDPPTTLYHSVREKVDIAWSNCSEIGSQPSLKSVMASKEAIHHADLVVARWFYNSCIPLNAINSDFAQRIINAIAAIGHGYKLPSYYKLRVNLLRDYKEEDKLLIDSYRRSWSEIGCKIMADGWTDNRNRTLANQLH
ncbi:hypothetical protein M5K25_012966 [Dendrobium thyrsiflorum]|uniref:DUF659 domain-containing protein n=1 Tax=Dendrobium thyrsiflorum TaxID=117978 RepID=A0ABD0UYZ1_DENTH